MPHKTAPLAIALVSALLAAGPAFAQTAFPQATKQATTGPIADIYVQTQSGLNVYNANAAGQLTLVKGSPFYEPGQMEGINSGYLINVGTDDLHSYKVESNGAIGAQAAQIDTQSYAGYECGGTAGPSLLDHNGQFFSVGLYGSTSGDCSSLQTYKLASNGEFTFLGDAVSTNGVHSTPYQVNVTTYSSNDLFAYGVQSQQEATAFLAYQRGAAGDLVVNGSFTEKDPTPDPSDSNYAPWLVAADNASHLAVVMNEPFGPNCCSYFQLASYSINDQTGGISSTNTYQNMPVLQIYADDIGMSWGGNLVAVGGSPGLQIFHFNGAAPATAFDGVLLPKININQVAWDKDNHLYALSYSSGQLYVYTVTSTSITEVAGSPYTVAKPYGYNALIVVPK
ncbi:MAG: hypothetical protein WA374_03725 [Acidobacteriaceae bacterium]